MSRLFDMENSIGKKIKFYRLLSETSQTELGLKIWPEISRQAAQGRIKRVECDEMKITNEEIDIFCKILRMPKIDLENEVTHLNSIELLRLIEEYKEIIIELKNIIRIQREQIEQLNNFKNP